MQIALGHTLHVLVLVEHIVDAAGGHEGLVDVPGEGEGVTDHTSPADDSVRDPEIEFQ